LLFPRAKDFDRQEDPVERPLLSLCVIARDEEATLHRALQSAARYVDEIVVVDAGSTDGTARVAIEHGARVVYVAWENDFSAARNAALDAARGTFALVVDADEWIESGPHPASLRAVLEASGADAFQVEIADRMDDGGTRRSEAARILRNRPDRRYTGAVHERIEIDDAPPVSGLVLGHDGFQHSNRLGLGKITRRIALLEAMLAEKRGAAPLVRYLLAREATILRFGRAVPGAHLAEVLQHLAAIAEDPGTLDHNLVADAARLHAAALLATGRAVEAAEVLEDRGDRGVACDLLRADAEIAYAGEDPHAGSHALEIVRACFDRPTRDLGPYAEPLLAGPVARARAAEILARLARFDEARELAREAASLGEGSACGWAALATVERAAGHEAEALRAYLEALKLDAIDPWSWAGLGEILLAAGSAAEAVEPLRNAALLAPGWDAVEEALASAFLLDGSQDRIVEFFGERGGERGAGAQAGVILASAAAGEPCPLERVAPEADGSVRRILGRLANAGRPDLLHRLALGLRAVSARS
jgi:tetratricopeptide (TPR) repeat protein